MHVVGAFTIGDEDNRLAVGTEARLRIERHATGDARGVTTGERHRVEIAEHVEGDRGTVGAHVER